MSSLVDSLTAAIAEWYAMCGETERALDVLTSSVNEGFCPDRSPARRVSS
jgi:pentatricopeptide repeat protein